jgi:hypothetical protein
VADPRKTAAGGLAVALAEVLNNTGGLWFGWSGKIVETPEGSEPQVHTQQAGPVKLAKPRAEKPESFWGAAVASVLIVAACCAVALVGFTLALPKPAPELPRATAKVTT